MAWSGWGAWLAGGGPGFWLPVVVETGEQVFNGVDELWNLEWFADEAERLDVAREYSGTFGPADNDDRRGKAAGTELSYEAGAIHSRHRFIEQDHHWLALFNHVQGDGAVCRGHHIMPFELERGCKERTQAGVVVDNEDRSGIVHTATFINTGYPLPLTVTGLAGSL
jgi:hypothetical protein